MNRPIEVKVKVEAVPGDIVDVCNYRKSDQWEQGEVRSVEIAVDRDGKPIVRYNVWVSRTPKHPRGRYGYFLCVQRDRIHLIQEHEEIEV